MTSEEIKTARTGLELWEFAYTVFLRLLALFFLALTMQVWMQAIGIAPGSETGFDKMPFHWRLAISALCVLHPLTALGLWGLFSWGIAVWLINVLTQLSMYLLFATHYGFDQMAVIFHIICLAIFAIFQLSLRFTNNKV